MSEAEMRTDPLEQLRMKIDQVDARLLALVARRIRLARTIGRCKRSAGRPTLDPEQEAAVVRRAAERARAVGLDTEAVRELYWRIIGLSRRAQQAARTRPAP